MSTATATVFDKPAYAAKLSEQTFGIPWTPVMEHHPERLADRDQLFYRTATPLAGDLAERAAGAMNAALKRAEREHKEQFEFPGRGDDQEAIIYSRSGGQPYLQIAGEIAENVEAMKAIAADAHASEALQKLRGIAQRYTDEEIERKLGRMPAQQQDYSKRLEHEYRITTPSLRLDDSLPVRVAQAIGIAAALHADPDINRERQRLYTSERRNDVFRERLIKAYEKAGLVKSPAEEKNLDTELRKIIDSAAAVHVRFVNGVGRAA